MLVFFVYDIFLLRFCLPKGKSRKNKFLSPRNDDKRICEREKRVYFFHLSQTRTSTFSIH